LSFLGVGIPPEIPTWGNIMAEDRTLFRVFPHNILFPGTFLAITILAVNMLGDGLRDTLDPRLGKHIVLETTGPLSSGQSASIHLDGATPGEVSPVAKAWLRKDLAQDSGGSSCDNTC